MKLVNAAFLNIENIYFVKAHMMRVFISVSLRLQVQTWLSINGALSKFFFELQEYFAGQDTGDFDFKQKGDLR